MEEHDGEERGFSGAARPPTAPLHHCLRTRKRVRCEPGCCTSGDPGRSGRPATTQNPAPTARQVHCATSLSRLCHFPVRNQRRLPSFGSCPCSTQARSRVQAPHARGTQRRRLLISTSAVARIPWWTPSTRRYEQSAHKRFAARLKTKVLWAGRARPLVARILRDGLQSLGDDMDATNGWSLS